MSEQAKNLLREFIVVVPAVGQQPQKELTMMVECMWDEDVSCWVLPPKGQKEVEERKSQCMIDQLYKEVNRLSALCSG